MHSDDTLKKSELPLIRKRYIQGVQQSLCLPAKNAISKTIQGIVLPHFNQVQYLIQHKLLQPQVFLNFLLPTTVDS